MNLTGTWTKTSTDAATATYPDRIQFRASGTYRGSRGDAGTDFTIWDTGEWESAGATAARISTANDAMITYGCRESGGTLTFTDPAGVVVHYARGANE